MRLRLLDIIVCPVCKSSFQLVVYDQKKVRINEKKLQGCRKYCYFNSQKLVSEDVRKEAHSKCRECYQNEITEGQLKCSNGHVYSITGSVPRLQNLFMNQQRTKKTFDVEWKVFSYNEKIYGHSPEEELNDLLRRMVVNKVFFSGKTVLDAGCGIGRITQSISSLADEVVGIDFSLGVDEAQELNKENPGVHILQGDIMNLPFRESSFDYVYSKGVLHYVSNVRKCLEGLSAIVIPGGALSVTLYGKMSPLFERFTKNLRRVTVRLPIKAIYFLSYVLTPLLALAWKWSGVRKRTIDWNERAHMIFNWFASEYQNRASNEEAAEWFEAIGFENLRISDIPVGITGIKK